MSIDAAPRQPRGRRPRIVVWTLLAVMAAIALIVFFAFPWGPIDGLRVEGARLVTTPRPVPGATPRQVEVVFSTREDLAQLRERKGADAIWASLSACQDADSAQIVAVAQTTGDFREGRVMALGPSGTGDARRYRYRATFEDWLNFPSGSPFESVSPADIGGGSCFSLGGGSMWMGKLWSDRVPLRLEGEAARG